MLITSLTSRLVLVMERRSKSIGTLAQLDAEGRTSRQQHLEMIAPLRMKRRRSLPSLLSPPNQLRHP